jgi:hypothetical protein
MRVFLLLILIIYFNSSSFGQASDFIIIKKYRTTVKSYFPGSPIKFETVYGNYLSGDITAIYHDSLFIKQYQLVPNNFGINTVDTLGSYIIGIPYKDIRVMIFNKKQAPGFLRYGTIFIIGGLGYAVLNLVNGAYLHEPVGSKENLRKLGIALGVAGGGMLVKYFQVRSERNIKKYKIQYIHMNPHELKGF